MAGASRLKVDGQRGTSRIDAARVDAIRCKYRNPHQPAQDGNTVETDLELARYAENAVSYQASLLFATGKHQHAAHGARRVPLMGTSDTFDIVGSALSAQSLRLNLTASNLANMHDVAGDPASVYKRAARRVSAPPRTRSRNVLAGVDMLGVVESLAPAIERYDPGNPQANEQGLVYGSNVNAMEEMANMISASRSYQSNLEVFNTAKDLLLRTLSLGQG